MYVSSSSAGELKPQCVDFDLGHSFEIRIVNVVDDIQTIIRCLLQGSTLSQYWANVVSSLGIGTVT